MPPYVELVKQSQWNFLAQNVDAVQLVIDKHVLASRPYLDTYEVSLTAGQSVKNKKEIPDGEIWVLSKIEHRDIEPGIFEARFVVDGQELFPLTTLNNLQFLLALAKAYMVAKYLETYVTNNDTVTKTYRCMRIWHIYSKPALNKFLTDIGIPTI